MLVAGVQAAAAVVFLALLVRVALLLGATPAGAMTEEILYLRFDLFRPMLHVVIVLLALEGVQLLLPAIDDLRFWRFPMAGAMAVLDLVQAALLLFLGASLLRVFRPYSRRSLMELEVLARRSVETLARRVARKPAARAGPRRGA